MKRWIGLIIPLLIVGSLITWRLGQNKAELAAETSKRAMRMNAPALVSLATVILHDISHNFEATGTVEAPLNVKIAPKVTGRIEYLEVREGDRVRKGQVIVRIDPSDVEAQVQQQMASVAEAQYRLAQAKMGQNPADVSVNTQIRQQKAALESAKADYNQVRENYKALLAAASANVTDAQSKILNAKAVIKSAQANLENAKIKYDRVVGLYKKGFVSTQEVDDTKASLSVYQSELEVAQGQLTSATAQEDAVQQQAGIVKTKGKADIEAAKAKTTQAEAAFDYANANTAQKSAYKQSISALEAALNAERAGLKNAESKRRDTVLSSPMDGFITGRYADPGAVVTSGQPIIAVQFMKQIWVTVSIPEDASSKIHLGQQANIQVDGLPNRIFTGKIIQINPSADLESRQFIARIIIDNSQNLLKPGMFTRVSIETERIKNAVVVPREAVQKDKLGSYVICVDRENKAVRKPVLTGASDDDFIAIERGVVAGDKVVVMSGLPIKEGQLVVTGGFGKHGMRGQKPGASR